MSVRNLQYLFDPQSVALIGASTEAGSIGSVIARNLLRYGFDGPVLPVHPHHRSVEGVLAYPDVASLPLTPDLAVIATPPPTVAGLVAELGERGTRAVVIISAGFGRGSESEQAILDAAKRHLVRVVGPNTVGVITPNRGLNASFAHLLPEPGHLAFVTQSGAVVTAVIDWAQPRGIGFSHLVSLGDMADVDFGDMLDYLANDRETHAILLYIEGIRHARKFMSAARAAARMKPVIVVKSGREPEGARAAASHTGSLAGADDVYEAAFQRAGMLRVNSLEELFTATETLADVRLPAGDRLAIVTNGGGMGVMATDELLSLGGALATLSDSTIADLDRVLPDNWSKGNPVDIIGDAPPERLAETVRIMLDHHRDMDGLLILNCPTAVSSPVDCARALTGVVDAARTRVPVLTSWVGERTAGPGRDVLNAAGFATYDTPGLAVGAFMQLVEYVRNQQLLMQTPPSVPEAFDPDMTKVRTLLDARRGEEGWLSERDVQQVLTAYGVPVILSRTAASPESAGQIAEELDAPVALKILSPDITHKSDVGGVVLNLSGETVVREAARQMLEHVVKMAPDARIDGFTVQPMARRSGAHELIIGMHEDPQFGPVLLFGHGGTAVEVINDRALGLPPLNLRLARDMMRRTRVHRLLEGYRDRPAADLDAIAMTLLRVSQLVVDFPEIRTLDVNPLLADEHGVVALDARIYAAAGDSGAGDGTARLAIRPYPKALESMVTTVEGRSLLLRPIVPEDEPALQAGFANLTPEEIRMRFLAPLGALTHMLAARFTQLDYDRDMALVLTDPGIPGRGEIHAVVRISADPDNEQAEFAIIVRHEMTGQGVGTTLMQRIIEYARSRNIGEIWGVTLRENQVMRSLARSLGFTEAVFEDDPALVKLSLRLTSEDTGRH